MGLTDRTVRRFCLTAIVCAVVFGAAAVAIAGADDAPGWGKAAIAVVALFAILLWLPEVNDAYEELFPEEPSGGEPILDVRDDPNATLRLPAVDDHARVVRLLDEARDLFVAGEFTPEQREQIARWLHDSDGVLGER